MTLPTFDVPRGTARCICGRTLSDPLSVSRKTGPVCWAKTHPAPPRRPAQPRRRAVMAAPAPRTPAPVDGQLALDLDEFPESAQVSFRSWPGGSNLFRANGSGPEGKSV